MKDKVNVLFVCGYGVGSSAISEQIVKKALKTEGIHAELKHTAVGEINGFNDWTDIIAISTKLAEGVSFKDGVHVIKVKNVMDGKGIAKQIGEVVDKFYADARESKA